MTRPPLEWPKGDDVEKRVVTDFLAEWGERSATVVWDRYLPQDLKNGPEYVTLTAFEDSIHGKAWLYVDGEFGEELIPMKDVTSIRPVLEEPPVKNYDDDFDDDFEAEDPPEDEPPPVRRRYVSGDRVVLTQGTYVGTKATVAGVYGSDFDPMLSLDLDRPHSKVWHAPEAHVARLADDE